MCRKEVIMIKKKLFKFGSVFMCAALIACSFGAYVSNSNVSKQEAVAATASAGADSERIISEAITSQLSGATKAVSSTENSKEELVYVFADANGVQDHIIVNEKLKNVTGKSSISDVSALKNITNISGDETFVSGSNNALTWDAAGSSIMYQGTTSKTPPITMKVTYYLDGKEITPQNLAGKSGKVTIRYDYINNQKTAVAVNGKDYSVAVPFTMITGMVLPSEHFSNIEVTNGKLSEVSDSTVVIGMTMPGLKESLNLKFDNETLDMDIPEYFEVTADVTDFELDMSMSVATSNLLPDLNADEISIDSLKSRMAELQTAADQLTDGTAELQKGTEALADNVPELQKGVEGLDSAASMLTDATSQLAAGGGALNEGAVDLKTGVYAYADGVGSASVGAQSLNENMTAYAAAMQQLYNTLSAGDNPLDTSVYQLAQGANALNSAVNGETGLKAQLLAGKQLAADSYKNAYDSFYALQSGIVKQQLVAAGCPADQIEATSEAILLQKGLSKTADVTSDTQYALATGAILENYPSMKGILQAKGMTEGEAQKNLVAVISGLSQAYKAYDTCETTFDSLNQAGANNFFNGVAIVSAGLTQLQESVGTFASYKEGTLCSSIYALNLNAQKLKAEGTSALSAGLTEINKNSTALKSGVGTLSAGMSSLSQNLDTLSEKTVELKNGTSQLNSAAVTLGSGVTQLNEGAVTLKDGMVQFNETGIKALTSLVGTDADTAIDTLKAIIKAGQEYQSFAGKAEDMEGSVTFIYKTDGVTK